MSPAVHFTITICTTLLTFSYFTPQGECCDAFTNAIGNVTRDHDILVGSDLIVNCHLYSNSYIIDSRNNTIYVNSSSLLFKLRKQEIDKVKIIDDLTLQLRIQNASQENSGTYTCYLKIPEGRKKLVCVGTYNVGYKSLPAENFTCRSYELQRLRCTWDPPFNKVKTNYTLYDNIVSKNECHFNFIDYERVCPHHNNDNSCEWSVRSAVPYIIQRKKLCFKLVSENTLGKNVQFISLDHYAIVVPGTPQKFKIDKYTSDKFVASWSPPEHMGRSDQFPPGLIYEVWYKPDYSKSWQVRKLNETYLNVSGLIPYTNYKIQVRCRSSVAVGDDMWGEFEIKSFQTYADVPYLAPEVTTGLFETRDNETKRIITLYWKGVSQKYWNGNGFKYLITYTESHLYRGRRSTSSEIINSNETFAIFRNLEKHTSYEFVLYSTNDKGKSLNFSTIRVPRKDDAPETPKDITVMYHKGHYNISWENPREEKDNVVSYTIYWCKMKEPSLYPCKGPINWMSVPAKRKAVSLNIDDMESIFQFAISANTYNISSGLKWAPCIVPRDGVLNKINAVALEPQSPYSMKVIWNLDCPVRKHLVQEYRISYCAAENENKICTDEARNITITDKEATMHILDDLKPFTHYRVVVFAITRSGSSEESNPQFDRTKPAAPSDSPQEFSVLRKTNTTIEVTWSPPRLTHGGISSYIVRIMKGDIDAQKRKIIYPARNGLFAKFEQLTPYTAYIMQVTACVDYFCSPSSSINVTTDVGVPGNMEGPMPQVYNETFVAVSWIPPSEQNGPIDFYVLHIQWENDDGPQTNDIDVYDASHYDLSVTCPADEKVMLYFFSILAANIKDKEILYGNRSYPVQSRLCFSNKGMELGLIIGITVGGALVLAVIIVALYFIIRWMKKEVDLIKDTEVHLPIGLQTPRGDPSYESFKNGLTRKRNDSNLSPKTFYGRLDSYASDESDPKDRTDSGMAPFGNNSREELLHNAKDQSEGKNSNGGTNVGKGNDSISSSLTTRTQLSSDSGAETDVQAPPSPESDSIPLCPPHTSPQPNKSSMPKVNEAHSCDSKDSGLEKEEGGSEKESYVSDPNQYTKFVRYLDNPSHPYNRRQVPDKGNTGSQQLPYSKFGVNMPGISGYVPLSTTLALMPRSLANSEPSVVDAETVNKDNPDLHNIAIAPAPPYSKYGIGRSLGQSLNMPGSNESDSLGTGYSKCGIGPDMSWFQQPKSPYIAANLASMFLGNDVLNQNKQLSPMLTENSKKTASPLPPTPLCSSPSRNKGYVTVDSMNKPSSFFPNQVNGPMCLPHEENRMPHSKGYVSVQDANKMLNEDRKLPKISEAKDQAAGIPGYSKFDIQCDRLQNTPDIHTLDPVLTGTKPKAYPSGIHQGYMPCNNPTFDISSINTPFNSDGSYAVNGSINGDLSSPQSELNMESENSDYEFDTDSHSPSKYLPQSKTVKSPSELNNGYVRVKADSSIDGIRIVPTDSQLRSSLTDTAV